MKARWQHPRILALDEYKQALGDCLDGSTPTDTTCQDGQSTTHANNASTPHACTNGGFAGPLGCSAGQQVVMPKACYDGMVVE